MKKKFLLPATLVGAAALGLSFTAIGSVAVFANPSPYILEFTETKNVLDNGEGVSIAHLAGGTIVNITHSNYYHTSNDDWGSLHQNGYFSNDTRIGGMTAVSYSIDGDIFLEYGYSKYEKPTFYNTILSSGTNIFNFPIEYGFPDMFKFSNLTNEIVTISYLNIEYSCSQQDEHIHYGGNVELVDGEYGHVCPICGHRYDTVDVSQYKMKIGTSSDNLVEYTPFNLGNYTGAGTLSFEYDNDRSFVLTIVGNHTGENIYVDSNIEGATSIWPRLTIRGTNNATIHDITFKGGYGILLFEGEPLKFYNGAVYSEARYTTVRSTLNFEDTRLIKTALRIDNGQLVIEGSAEVNITGYEYGINFLSSQTNTGGLTQSGGTLNIFNTNVGIGIGYSSTLRFSGNSTMQVSKNALVLNNSVKVDVTRGTHTWAKSGSENDTIGIANTNNSNSINIFNGASLTVDGFNKGFNGTGAVCTINVLGNLNIINCFTGVFDCSVVVGDNENKGRLYFGISTSSSSSSQHACGISQNQFELCDFVNGQVIFFGDSRSYSEGIMMRDGYSTSRLIYHSRIEVGFAHIERMHEVGVLNDKEFVVNGALYSYDSGDPCWYSHTKPPVTSLSQSEFNNKFGL